MADLNRRNFIRTAAGATVSLVVLGAAEDLLAQATSAPASTTVDIGKPADYAKDTISTKFAKDDKILIANSNGRIYALTAVCTHRKATITQTKDNQFRCPSHGSMFDITGKRTAGPATAPLARHAIKLNDKGNLIVDKTKSFDEAKWDDADAFYKLA